MLARVLASVWLFFTLSPVIPTAQQLAPDAVEAAIQAGTAAPKKTHGIFINEVPAMLRGAAKVEGFRATVYTPMMWVQQQAADAARAYRPFTAADLNDRDTAPVLRVSVQPSLGYGGRWSSVERIILRDERKRIAVQPEAEEPFEVTVQNAYGAQGTFSGMAATFPLEAVAKVRGANETSDFFITVVGSGNVERDLKIKGRDLR